MSGKAGQGVQTAEARRGREGRERGVVGCERGAKAEGGGGSGWGYVGQHGGAGYVWRLSRVKRQMTNYVRVITFTVHIITNLVF